MRGSSNGNTTRKSSGPRIPPIHFKNKNGTIEKVNNSLGNTTTSTVISEDNTSILSLETDEGHSPALGGKRNRFNSSPTQDTPVRNKKFQRRSGERKSIVMDEITEANDTNEVSTNGNRRTSTYQNSMLPSIGHTKKL